MRDATLSVIMPAYEEEENVAESIEETVSALSPLFTGLEIVAVNDGSDDRTERVIAEEKRSRDCVKTVSYTENKGKGYALRQGFEAVSNDVDLVLFLDADAELDPCRLQRFLDIKEEQDAAVVIGSKHHPESQVDYPSTRKLLSEGYSVLLRLLFRLDVRDSQCGMKLFDKEVLDAVMPLILVKRYAFDIEILALARRKGYTIAEAPVSIDFNGDSGIDLRAIFNIGLDTAAVFYRMHLIHYYRREECRQTAARSGPQDGPQVDAYEHPHVQLARQ